VSHAEPWANPSAPLKVLQWLGQEDAPLLFRIRADMRQWLWGLSVPAQLHAGAHAPQHRADRAPGHLQPRVLQQLRADTGIQYDQRTQGILHFYTNPKEFDGALAPAEQMRGLGCERQVISADEAVRIEPALAHIRPQLAGATFTAEDESGDANQFTRELAKLCEAAGVQFRMGHHITALREVGGSIDHVELTNAEGRFQRVRGDAFVLAMGSFSPLLAAAAGHPPADLPGQGLFGDHAGEGRSMAHQVSLTDDEFKLVFSRYTSERGGDRLRIAGTAELNGYDRDLNRCAARPSCAAWSSSFPARATRARRSSGPACAPQRPATCR
jgi:D-amino-acid dehydrogenase